MISVLCPTRKRPREFERMITSAWNTACQPHLIEIVARVDDDDHTYGHGRTLKPPEGVTMIQSPRIRQITDLWNQCFAGCSGDIVMQANDDIIFRTRGWDMMVEGAFAACPDKILMVHGDHQGGYDGRMFGPHPFVHRRWVQTLGYFTPPYFSSDFGDTWINDLANALGRRLFLPFVVEHMHFTIGKSEEDQTTKDRLLHHHEDAVEQLYDSKLKERVADANRLGKVMKPPREIAETRFYGNRSAGDCPRCHGVSTVYDIDGFACNSCGYRSPRWHF